MIARPALLTAMLGALPLLWASQARAERSAYRGAHPIPAQLEGNFCHIGAPHTHTYPPGQSAEHFQVNALHYEFIGDPSLHGYEGPIIPYFGPHPQSFSGSLSDPVNAQGEGTETESMCAAEGDHFHLREPGDFSQYEERAGTYYFGSYREAKQNARRLRRKAKRRPPSRHKARRSATLQSNSSQSSANTVASTPSESSRAKAKASAPEPRKSAYRSWFNKRRGR